MACSCRTIRSVNSLERRAIIPLRRSVAWNERSQQQNELKRGICEDKYRRLQKSKASVCEPYFVGFSATLHEPDEPLSFLAQCQSILFRERRKGFDSQRGGSFLLFNFPDAAHKAIDQDCCRYAQRGQIHLRAVFIGD